VEGQQLAPEEGKNQQQLIDELCPQASYVGWHASPGCKEYFECTNGVPGVIHVCGDSLKFDKVNNECRPEQTVNEFCYGPPPSNNQNGPPPSNSGQVQQEQQQQTSDLCPESYVGWATSADCREYYQCDNGKPGGVIYVCNESLKYDKVRNKCRPEQEVNSFCYGPPPSQAEQVQQQTVQSLCKEGYTGWEARLGCREYYWCDNGRSDVMYECGEDLLFDRTNGMCNFKHLVHCVDKGGPATPPPVPPTPWPTPRPTQKVQTLPPTLSQSPSSDDDWSVGANAGGNPWSNTATPTAPGGQSEIPPWLMTNTVGMKPTDNSGGDTSCSHHMWLRFALIILPFQAAMIW
jgi:hypothetical protein